MSEKGQYQDRFSELKCCVIVPTYNNNLTIADVLIGVLTYTSNIIVVNDGSNDNTAEILNPFNGIDVVSYEVNKGKGHALRTGFEKAVRLGYDYAITIDSDGQHYPEDLPDFLNHLENNLSAIIIGSRNMNQENVPGKSSFGNNFSNFWFKIETGISLPDTQSGYRLYPVKLLQSMSFFTKKFEFEIEVMVRAAWKGISVIPIPVKVYYAPKGERISHFRPFVDFSRISILNTFLVIITFLYIKPRDLFRYLRKTKVKDVIKTHILQSKDSNEKIASAVGFGFFMGIIPIWGFQMLVALFLAQLLKLNKAIVIIAANISVPPMIPFILYLSYMSGGLVFKDGSETILLETFKESASNLLEGKFSVVMNEMGYSFMQYIVGSLIFAVIAAISTGLLTYLLLLIFRKKRLL